MAINTRYGSEIRILAYDEETGDVEIERLVDGEQFLCHISELRADGGIHEIVQASVAVSKTPPPNVEGQE